jgi:pimeloyl-ACP methyl ester carboxylesterase
VRIFVAAGNIDVTNLLTKLTVPTLVMHARDDARVPFDAGRQMAAGIPGARFVPLPSRNHLILEDEPAFASVPPEERWLFPGRKPGQPVTTRQLNRLFALTRPGV